MRHAAPQQPFKLIADADPDAVEPVSYTHLDVYKRQLLAQEEIRGLIIGEPSFAGLVGLSNTAFTLRVSFTTLPLKQWTVRFALDTQVKKHFDRAGVRAPVQTWQQLPMPGADSPAAE